MSSSFISFKIFMKLKKLNEKKNGITFLVFKNKERFWWSELIWLKPKLVLTLQLFILFQFFCQ